jgi:hypothetical protein
MEKLNAIVKMTKLIEAVERWGAEFEAKYVYHSPTGPLYPKANIGAIEGGALDRAMKRSKSTPWSTPPGSIL